MNKLKLLLILALLCGVSAIGQVGLPPQIKIISFTVQHQLPSVIDSWNSVPGSVLLVAQMPPNAKADGLRLMLQIRANGAVVCNNNAAGGLPVDKFTTRSFSAAELTGALSMCHDLKDGSYSICAQFFNGQREAASNEMCKEFLVQKPVETDYAPPTLITPDNGKQFTEAALQRPVMFRWTTPVPKPKETVTYRLRVWQLMQGQSGMQAMKANQPIVTKDIDNITQTVVTNVITGPCRPPYMCDFIWNVQAVNPDGKPLGRNDGTSEPFLFSASQYIIRLDSIKVSCTPTPGLYTFSYTITNPNPGSAKLTNFIATSSVPAGATITGFTPPLNTIIASNSPLTITGTINGSPALSNICIGAEITDQVNSFWKASKDTCVNIIPCTCDACNEKKTNINIVPTNNIVLNANNTLTISQPITITNTPPKMVKSIKAELVYFEFVPESENCLPCNKDSKTYGNFDNGTLASITGMGGGTHALQWSFAPPKNFSGGNTAGITITLPPTVKCCDATIRWCIRYVVTFVDCTVCNKLVCYEKKKEGCVKGNPIPDKQN